MKVLKDIDVEMATLDQVRASLAYVFNGLKDGSLKPNVAKELNNACGKVLTSAKLELEYYSLRKEAPVVGFLGLPGPAASSNGHSKARPLKKIANK